MEILIYFYPFHQSEYFFFFFFEKWLYSYQSDEEMCIQLHVFFPFERLISLMLKREPGHRANLGEIEDHNWLKIGSNDIPHHHMPLMCREHVSEEVHNSVVDTMVEGNIGTKEEILQ